MRPLIMTPTLIMSLPHISSILKAMPGAPNTKKSYNYTLYSFIKKNLKKKKPLPRHHFFFLKNFYEWIEDRIIKLFRIGCSWRDPLE